jgi:kinesin family member 18/19
MNLWHHYLFSVGHNTIPCLKTERVSQSPQFMSCNKKSTAEQSEEELEELSMTAVDDIQHDIITGFYYYFI